MKNKFVLLVIVLIVFSCKFKNKERVAEVLPMPFHPDTSVLNINFLDRKSYNSSFKEPDVYLIENNTVIFTNESHKEKLKITFQSSDSLHTASKFEISENKSEKEGHELIMVSHFRTSHGLKIGSDANDILTKIGQPTSKDTTYESEIWHFELENHVDFFDKYGILIENPYEGNKNIKDRQVAKTYAILRRYNYGRYYADYIIKNKKISQMRFGLDRYITENYTK